MFSNQLNYRLYFLRLLPFFILTLLVSFNTIGQDIIQGKVTAKDNGDAIAGASVYISNTTIGVATDGNGVFKLTNTPKIPFVLNVSSIGFKTKVINVNPLRDTLLNITLTANVQQLKEVVITPDNDVWAKFGYKFLQDLIGYSEFSGQCKIKNLENVVLDFDR